MATFTIDLYSTDFRLEERAIYDEIESYLATCPRLSLASMQYLKQLDSLTRTLKVDLDQSYYADGIAYQYNYAKAKNNETGNILYYYVTGIRWIAESTAELSLELDYMNTYRKEVRFTGNTHITRRFKDRWRKNNVFATDSLIAKIDPYPEGFSAPSMVLATKKEITQDPDIQWHLAYYTDYSSDDDVSKAPLKVGLFPDKQYDIGDSSYSEWHTYQASDFQTGIWYYFNQGDGTLERTTSTGVTQTIDMSTGYWGFKLVAKSSKSTFIQFGLAGSATSKMTTADVDFTSFQLKSKLSFYSTTTSTSATNPTWDQLANTKDQEYSGYENNVRYIMSFDDWYEENKTNSLVSKIIAIPYLPFSVTVSDGIMTYDTDKLQPTHYEDTRGFLSPIDYSSDWMLRLPRQSGDIITIDKSELSHSNEYNLDLESKIYHSDYCTVKYAYGNDSYALKLEDVDMSPLWVRTGGTLINYYLGKTVTSALAFHVMGNQTDTTDYEGWIISNQDLSVATFSNEYLNYVKYGKYYDEKANQLNVLYGLGKMGEAYSRGQYLSGSKYPLSYQTMLNMSSAVLSVAYTIDSAKNSMEAKIAQYQSQASSVSTTNSIDIFTAYQGNRLLRITYEPRKELKEAIQDFFRNYGYATDEYGQMTDSRYWNDYYVADVEFSKDTLVSNLMKEAIRRQYSNGVRIYHWHDGYDLDRKMENEETSLIEA